MLAAILPPAVLGMPEELERVDRLLDDPRFFEPFRAFFDPVMGRPSIPIETYTRLMFLMSARSGARPARGNAAPRRRSVALEVGVSYGAAVEVARASPRQRQPTTAVRRDSAPVVGGRQTWRPNVGHRGVLGHSAIGSERSG
jgi:hypothetical protein